MPLVFRPGGKEAPPPHITETVVDGWAHCHNARCDGYGQQPVRVVREVVSRTVGSRGGDGIFMGIVENSNEYLRFADEQDVTCPHCGLDREVSLQERPSYPAITGFPQDGLLNAPQFDASVRNSEADQRQAQEMADLRKQLADLSAQVKGKAD